MSFFMLLYKLKELITEKGMNEIGSCFLVFDRRFPWKFCILLGAILFWFLFPLCFVVLILCYVGREYKEPKKQQNIRIEKEKNPKPYSTNKMQKLY